MENKTSITNKSTSTKPANYSNIEATKIFNDNGKTFQELLEEILITKIENNAFKV